ncbi:protein CNGC15b-like [Rhodamnia argentea]|uniref:Protein CNGC15b-like n=1 Tax=Rhodamnia argentea TaxID=178133 RepID=A0A8B8NVK8_9MYRT|nr:protein CNGC15b-like [Rhodamnia argentea]
MSSMGFGGTSIRSRSGRVGDESLRVELQRTERDRMTGRTSKEDVPILSSALKDTSHETGKSLRSKVLHRVFSEDYERAKNYIFDPRGRTIHRWNRIFLTACVVSLFVDPLFLFVPSLDSENYCIGDASTAKVILTTIRSVLDAFYAAQIIVRFRTAYVAPSSRVFGRGELVIDSKRIATRYFSRGFYIDLFAAIPLPQVLIWAIIPGLGGSITIQTKNVLLFIIFIQHVPRILLLLPLRSEIINASGALTERAWAGAAFNLLIYMLYAHIAGACWYLNFVLRQEFCWEVICDQEPSCRYDFFDCRHVQYPGRSSWHDSTNATALCNPNSASTPVQWGIYKTVLGTSLAGCEFFSKYFFCYWWGLNNLSDIGQNLLPGTYVGELLFVNIFATHGLLLFALLIGNMQRYLHSATIRFDQWMIKRTDTEQWMHHRHLPPELRQSVRMYDQYKWATTRGVDEEALVRDLPMDLRREIKRHLCFDLVRRVPLFNQMDERTLDAICERLKPVLCTQNMYLVREGDPTEDMFFIIRGHLESWTTNDSSAGFLNSCRLGPGDFCGEELLTWALDPRQGMILPTSTRTVKALKEVEAFSLAANDLKFVALQFRRLHSKELRHKFRFYSHQWRTWAACFIQSKWRRHKKLKEEAKLDKGGARGKSNSSRSFWDMYARELIESTRRDQNNQVESGSDAVNKVEKPVDLDFSADY